MKALVTGAKGFCGKHLHALLDREKIEVHSIGRELLQGSNFESLVKMLEKSQPDFIFHLAGISWAPDWKDFYEVNCNVAARLLKAIEITGLKEVPTLIVGTSAEYGQIKQDQLPIVEDLPPLPYNHYGASKLAQTSLGRVAFLNGHSVVLVRPFNIIGPGMPGHLSIQSFAGQLKRIVQKTLPPVIKVGNLSSSRDFIDVQDVAMAYLKLLQSPSAFGQVVNICSGGPTIIQDVFNRMIELWGISVEFSTDPTKVREMDIPVHYGNPSKLCELTDFTPKTPLDQTLRRIFHQEMCES